MAEQKRAAKFVALTTLLFLAVVGGLSWQAIRYPDAHPGGAPREAKITIDKGMTLGEIAKRLAAAGLIDHPSWFRFYANER
ncbi:MAG: hypothetical protein ACXVCV_11815, partial [Polyangia bacterium]